MPDTPSSPRREKHTPRKPGERYTTLSYRRAIERAVEKLDKHLTEQAAAAEKPRPH